MNEFSRNWSNQQPSASLRLYVFTWENKKQFKSISSIALVAVRAAGDTGRTNDPRSAPSPRVGRQPEGQTPSPFCLAITAEIHKQSIIIESEKE